MQLTASNLVLIGICALIYLLDGLIHSILGPLAPDMARSLSLGNADLGPIFSANLLGQCIGLVLLPALAGRIGHRLTVTLCVVGFGLGQCASALAESGTSLFAMRLVTGVFLGAKHAAPVMKRQRRGVILVTASTSALRPRPGVQSYSASKGAVVALTKSLALELAPYGVRAVALAPVATETPMLPRFSGKDRVDEDLLRKYLPTIPLGRLNTPEDVARTALFLASDDAGMITGACVEVDGGRCI